jgi:CPA2 family monovalent cation:H+ antiporter-2
MALLVLVFSSAVLPRANVLVLLALVVAGVAFLLRRTLIRVYAKAQIALQETLSQPPPPRAQEPTAPLGGLFKAAEIERIGIAPSSPAVGKLIRQLALRSQTGASIVAIERNGATLVNPGPDEELAGHDQVLLLGTRRQLNAARSFLAGSHPEAGPP